ncbi:MAG: PxKF domain-containing protein [Acidimicrobiia bacterium]
MFAGAIGCTPIVGTGYTFSGFSAPVDAAPTLNVVKAGQTVPLKFHVSDSSGAPVTDLSGVTIEVTSLACSAGATSDLLEEVATGGSGLQNLGDGYYQFNWKTPKSYASSCKTMSLDLGNGTQHTALFHFRK